DDASYAEPAGQQPGAQTGGEPLPVSEQLFGSYHSGSDEYVDTAIIPRITDHGTIVEDESESAPPAAGDGGDETHGHDEYGHDEYGHQEYGHDEYGHDEYGAPGGEQADGQPAKDKSATPAASVSDAQTAESPVTEAPDTETPDTDAPHTDTPDTEARDSEGPAKNRPPVEALSAAAIAAAPAAGLMAAHGAAVDADNPHAVGPELLAGYSDTDQSTTRRADDEIDEGRTDLIPRYTDGRSGARGKGGRPVALALALLLVTVVGAGAAYFCWTKAQQAADARPTGNIAFVDPLSTAGVRDQVSKAIEAIYSYDSTQLDDSENRALSFITGDYSDEFKQNFATVRQLAPQEKAQLTSTVVEAGVQSLTESRATLLVMVNQVGHRGDNPQPLRAAVRLSVTAEKVGGQWKVSGVNQK
ncbi:MAG: Mce-associated rane protein, partial [Pseudonocardiales bacterium]|nr:Mce-associated rane protein [Pseudonocardiales bacterium]